MAAGCRSHCLETCSRRPFTSSIGCTAGPSTVRIRATCMPRCPQPRPCPEPPSIRQPEDAEVEQEGLAAGEQQEDDETGVPELRRKATREKGRQASTAPAGRPVVHRSCPSMAPHATSSTCKAMQGQAEPRGTHWRSTAGQHTAAALRSVPLGTLSRPAARWLPPPGRRTSMAAPAGCCTAAACSGTCLRRVGGMQGGMGAVGNVTGTRAPLKQRVVGHADVGGWGVAWGPAQHQGGLGTSGGPCNSVVCPQICSSKLSKRTHQLRPPRRWRSAGTQE